MYVQFITLLLYLLYSSVVFGHPIKQQKWNKLVLKDEKKYPNGTVVGKYSYRDKDGNPINVRYFADDSSYGVELKSIKVFGAHPDLLKDRTEAEIVTTDAYGALDVINTANAMLSKNFLKNKTYNPLEVLNTLPKESHYKGNRKQDDDYEIFLENDIKPSEKCNKEKVRVYTDKYKRKIREAANENKLFCERF